MANAYTISGDPVDTAAATDPDLCRISGYLKGINGAPLKGHVFFIRHCYSPISVGTTVAVLREKLTITSNRDGYVEFDLYRNATIYLELPNRAMDLPLELVVPDAASVDLIDFMFPHLVSVAFVNASPIDISVGERVDVTTEGTLSNGVVIPLDGAVVTLESSDPGVLLQQSSIGFTGFAVGSATISVTNVDDTALALNQEPDGDPIIRFDVPAVTLPTPLDVNVT